MSEASKAVLRQSVIDSVSAVDGPAAKRWFSTGFTAGGLRSVDGGKYAIRGASMIQRGEAKGHGFWIDQEFVQQVRTALAEAPDPGVKARFGHPGMCDDALGTYLGRWRAPQPERASYRGAKDAEPVDADPNKAVGDLFLSSSADSSPRGELRKYVLKLAQSDPAAFGASIVFQFDRAAMRQHMIDNGAKPDEDGDVDWDAFKSPDSENVDNLPHARLAALHAIDLVDSPAATSGLFSGATGPALASQVSEWLDTHPEVFAALNDSPDMVNILMAHAAQVAPFLERYNALRERKQTMSENASNITVFDPVPAPVAAEPAPAALAAEPAAPATPPADPAVTELKATVDKLTAEVARLTAERDDAKKANAALLAGEKPLASAPVAETKPNIPKTPWG